MKDLWQYLKTVNKPIVLYGMGNGADHIMHYLDSYEIEISGVFASDDFVRGHQFHGFEVLTYSKAKSIFGDMIVLLCFGTQRPEIIQRIKNIASEQELYAPDVPVYGDGLFTAEYAALHRNELQTVYDLLADDISKKVFRSVIEYRITGDIQPLFQCETPADEAYKNILKLNDDEIYLDLGAYNGDTIREFLSHTNGYRKIIAVEPDKKNFKKLQANTQSLNNIEIHNIGIHNRSDNLYFEMNSGRNSKIGNSGNLIKVNSVDNILYNSPATYIKMDVEGQEANAIEGAKETIKNYRPKMLISCYHRTQDIYTLPLQVHEICNNYKIFMRHYPYLPAWDTSFYFV